MIRLCTLGSVDLRGSDGQQARPIVSKSKRVALLVYLALGTPRGAHRRDSLIAMFWPEHDGERARNSLSQSVHVLRRSLGAGTIIGTNGDALALEWRDFWCDAVAFEDSLDAGRISDAVEIYQGNLLEGFHLDDAPDFERWLAIERTRLASRYAQAVTMLAEQRATDRDFDGSAAWWRRLVAHDPYSSRAALGLMRALAAAGDPAAAVQHARAHETLLRDDLDVAPDPEIPALVRQLKSARPLVASVPAGHRGPSTGAGDIATPPASLPGSVHPPEGFTVPGQARDQEPFVATAAETPKPRWRVRGPAMALTAIALTGLIALWPGGNSWQPPSTHEQYLTELHQRGRQAELDRSFVGVQSAMGYYRRAIQYDSSFALGYAGLSGAYGLLADYDYAPARPALDSARLMARLGMAIDSTVSGTHTALAVSLGSERDFVAAERHFLKALRLDPNDTHARYWYASLLVALGRGQEALDQLALVTRTDRFAPRGATVMERYATWLITGKRLHLTVPVDKRPYPILDVEPGEAYALANDAIDRAHQRDCSAARAAVERAAELVPRGNLRISGFVAEVYRLCGDLAAMRSVVERMKQSPRAHQHGHWIAMLHAMSGEPDSAFLWLERTEWRLSEMMALSADRRFDPLRSDPKFAQLLQRLGLRKP